MVKKPTYLRKKNTDKAPHVQRSLLLDSIGEATLNIFEQLSHTGTDLDGAETNSGNLRTACTTYTNFATSNKERMKRGTCLFQNLKEKASIVTSRRPS